MTTRSAEKWAAEEFGHAQLGDIRRTRRLQKIAAGAASRANGRVAVVFDRMADREGTYDFLERGDDAAAVAGAMFRATATRARGEKSVLVAVDVSSLSLTDEAGTRGLGPVGSPNSPVRGLMVCNALVVTTTGVPLGLIDQRYWVRGDYARGTVGERIERNRHRPFEEKQGAYFVRAAARAIARLYEAEVVPWFVIDREGDSREILTSLLNMPCRFTIRGTKNRQTKNAPEPNVRETLELDKPRFTQEVVLPAATGRKARTAKVEVRAKRVDLKLHATPLLAGSELTVNAVLVRETTKSAKRGEPLDWLLYTNAPIATNEDVAAIVASYRARWRVEEFHRTWKQGHCNVEDAQLRSVEAMVTWAVILAAVAARIERLKYLSRATPDAPASVELGEDEIEALKAERTARYPNRELDLPKMPTIGEVTLMGKRSGPPGSITLARGLERLAIYVHALHDIREMKRKSRKNAPR